MTSAAPGPALPEQAQVHAAAEASAQVLAQGQAHTHAHRLSLEALRHRGAHRLDPYRFRLAEALARRAEAQEGAARHVLDLKISALLQALGDAAERGAVPAPDVATTPDQPCPQGGTIFSPLGSLLAHLAQHKAAAPLQELVSMGSPMVGADVGAGAGLGGRTADAASHMPSPVDAQTLEFFRRTWSRLSAEQRLAQSRSALPGNAGPLNSQHLVHRALTSMRELSPAYFERFMNHVDALLWLERAQEHAARQVGLPPRAKAGRKTAATRRG